MARLEMFSRNLGLRMLLLLFWTVFVCCVLYASRGRKDSDVSSFYLKDLSSSRLKRFANNGSSGYEGQCTLGRLTREDSDVLSRLFSTRQYQSSIEKPLLHCSVVSLCGKKSQNFQAVCFSRECSVFKVRNKSLNHVTRSLSSEELSEVIENALVETPFMTIDDLSRYFDVHCMAPTVSKMELSGDVVSSSQCQMLAPRTSLASHNVKNAVPKKHIHILYFRFLSQQELPVRFPGLVDLLGKLAKRKLMNFDKHQATKWGDDEMISLLLQGNAGPFKVEDSLLETIRKAGYCFRLEDLSCSKSRDQETLVTNVTSAKDVVCEGNPLRHREATMERMCTEGNLTDTKLRSVLTSLLTNVHELEGGRVNDNRPVLSISILNTKDFKNSEVLDFVLRNFFASALNDEDRVMLLLGGVGNPMFLRFDENTRLQSLVSNPAMVLVSAGNVSATTLADAHRLNQSLFSMRNVNDFVTDLVKNQNKEFSNKLTLVSDSGVPDSCESLHVQPPFTCLCEEHFVEYQNDTLMAGFAELAVGIINSRLENMPHRSTTEKSQCSKLSGVSFSNVRVGRHDQKRRILMDLNLEDELLKDEFLRHVALDVWDLDKIPHAVVNFYDGHSSSSSSSSSSSRLDFQTDRLLETLCREGESLDFHTASEKSLWKHWSQEKHFGQKGSVSHMHDDCLYMIIRDFGDSVGVEAANVCRDRRYDVMLHLSLMNMLSLTPLPLSVRLGHAQRQFLTAIVKTSYTVPSFAFKLHPDFEVFHDE
ncbi:uncharacterized protein [Littorina saxatilis]|uniref:Uncharacterized protein n=2 Tax=Littorina saxatilis TaxID=31220 RepID=A0AAN9BLR1_9CAEN